MQVVLVMFRGDGERRSFSIARDMTVIGRREDCDLRIPVGDVSRKHCRLVKEADTIRIEDLGSSNGTFVNSERIQEAVLKPGDTILIGPVQFVVQLDGLPTDEQLTRPAIASSTDDTAATGSILPLPPATEEPLEELPAEPVAEPTEEPVTIEEAPLEELAQLEEITEPQEVGELEELTELEELPAEPPPAPAAKPSRKAPPPLPVPPPIAEAATEPQDAGDWNVIVEDEAEPIENEVDFNIDLDAPQEESHA